VSILYSDFKSVYFLPPCFPCLVLNFVSQFSGGPGEYEVVQCGSAGHNIRSQPNMNGAPVGRLTLKDTFTAQEEVN